MKKRETHGDDESKTKARVHQFAFHKNRFIILLISSLCCATTFAQNKITGNLMSHNEQSPVAGAYILLMSDGRIVESATSRNDGKYQILDIPNGKYHIEITCLGYKAIQDSIDLSGNCQLDYILKEDVVYMDEVVVTADRSQYVTRTANGQRFYLSDEAKKKHNPFQALQEIPLLISDPNTSSVKMLNGSSPLILINGKMINSGISPISPSDIESVEIINSVSARYLQEGISSIVNIKLKANTKPYIWLQAATRHEIPIDKGFGVGYFEIGNKKVSLYGRASYNYIYHDDTESTVNRLNTTYNQNYEQKNRKDANKWLGELLLKYQATEKDYFAAQVFYSDNNAREKQNAIGEYITDALEQFKFNSFSKDISKILTSSLYYKHSFATNHDIEIRFAYNFNKNYYNQSRTDFYDEIENRMTSLYKNQRNSGSLNIDYSKEFSNKSSLIVGSRSTFLKDKINDIAEQNQIFHHKNFNQYIYVGYSGTFKKIYYGASLGVEGIWAKAGNANYGYIRPRGSASITWSINDNNSLQARYTLTNSAPSITCLNPYNTSLDPLIVSVGNPNLKPQMDNSISMNYTFNINGLYISPEVSYRNVNDMIEAYGYTKDGIYYSTYANSGRFSQLSTGLNASYRFNWGRIYAGGGWMSNSYSNQQFKSSLFASCGLYANVKKFSFVADLEYNSRDYTAISLTKYYQPSIANLQINYNFTPDFYIGICLQHATGEFRSKTIIEDDTYKSIVENKFKEQCFRPWIILRYTFRKNSEKKHKLGKVLNSEESGISIIR